VTEGLSIVFTIVLVVLAWYLFKYKAGYQGGRVTEDGYLDLGEQPGDAQATTDLGTVGIATTRTKETGLHSETLRAEDAAVNKGSRARGDHKKPIVGKAGLKSFHRLSRRKEKHSDVEQGNDHSNLGEGN
jgi:hypothetical protein